MDHIFPNEQHPIHTINDEVRLDYKKAIHCIRGSDVKIYDANNYTDISDAIRDAIRTISDKQGDRGVTVLWSRGWCVDTVVANSTCSSEKPQYLLQILL